MKQVTILLIVTGFLSIRGLAQCAQSSNIYTFSWGGKTYEIVKEMKSWSNAAACAVERGGYLAEINDMNEQNAIFMHILTGAGISPTYTNVPMGGGIAYVWIGGTDQTQEGTWLWDGNNDQTGTNFWTGQGANGSGNGAPVNGLFHNWGGKSTGTPNEPDDFNAAQDHAAIGLTGWPSGSTMLGIPGEWNDIPAASSLYFVIEKDGATGFNNLPETPDRVRLFPNPVKEELYIETQEVVLSIGLYDASGRLIYQYENTNSLALSGLNPSMYFIELKTLNGIFREKLILL